MVIFEGMPYPIDMLYLKVAGTTGVLSMPLVEALGILANAEFNYKESQIESGMRDQPAFVITGDTDTEKKKKFVVPKTELIVRLQSDIYDNKFKIADVIIQPQDELLTNAVKLFIES